VILLALPAFAATLRVGTDAATVADTLALATAGDTVEIPAGTWNECIDTLGVSLTITGEGATLDGTGLCEDTVRVAGGETVAITGLTVVNGAGRAFDLEGSTVTLTGVTVTGTGRTDWSGGGVWASGGTVALVGCTFTDNVAAEGAAVYLYAYTTLSDTGSTFEGNATTGTGGAVMGYYDTAITLDGSTFRSNTAGYYGGAVATWDYSDLTVRNATFEGNSAPGTGGGAILYYPRDSAYGTLDLASSTFVENSAADGGALWAGWVNDARITSSTFTGNTADDTGGAILAYVTASTAITHDTFCGNRATTGGAVSVQWTDTDTWSADTFVENTASTGGAVDRYAAYAGALVQNTFVGNAAAGWGGAYEASWAWGDFRNNLVVDTPSGAGAYTAESATYTYTPMAYDGWAGNAVADGAGYFYVEDGRDGNVVTDDPGFVAWSRDGDCTNDDLRLLGTSPFKDAGDPAILDVDGTRSDLGASGGPDQPVEDRDGDGVETTADCDDTTADRHPGAGELCNGADDDCNGVVDDATAADAATWYADADGDGYGDPGAPVTGCSRPVGTVDNADDCDDAARWTNPDASDLPGDGVDADCDGADNTQAWVADTGGDPDGADPADPGCGCASRSPACAGAGWLAAAAALGARRRRRPE
jgi:hypothetical protein